MPTLPHDATLLCLAVLLLGLKHGFDADHLAAIDGMTRLQCADQPRQARWCGAVFALGHGSVVLLVALLLGVLRGTWQMPPWLDATGRGISIGFLLLLGVANLRALLLAPAGQAVAPVGLRSRCLRRWLQPRGVWAVAGVGALFALSFDTLGLAALFSIAASTQGGPAFGVLLGLLFTAGMLTTDALNGWWFARLLARGDAWTLNVSRAMGWAVAGTSLLLAALASARWISSALDAWAERQGLLFSMLLVAALVLGYGIARWLARAGTEVRRSSRSALPQTVGRLPVELPDRLAGVQPSHGGHTAHPV